VPKKLASIFALLACLLALGVLHQCAPRHVPRGQAPLTRIDPENFHRLQEAFNSARDSTRVLLLFSPT
jgi:hypothetical protein